MGKAKQASIAGLSAELEYKDGYITSSGRYCGERRFIPYFDKRVVARRYNYNERDIDKNMWHICIVTAKHRERFPELEQVASVGIREEAGKCLSWVRSCSFRK